LFCFIPFHFIYLTVSLLNISLLFNLELLYKESALEHFDYEYCLKELRRHLDRQDSQLQGLCLLFLHHPEIRKEIHAAMDALKQLYQIRFLEVIALEFPKQQSSIDQSSLSSLEPPVETLDDSTIEIPNNICGQCYTDKSDFYSCNRDDCLEKNISGVQDLDPVPLQRSPVGFSHKSYSCGLCGMYHRKEQSCMADMRPRDSEKGLLGFHEFYGPSYHVEDFDIDEFVFDYLTSPYVLNGARS